MHFFRQKRNTRIKRRKFPQKLSGAYEKEFRKLQKSIETTPFTSFYVCSEEERLSAWPRVDVIGTALTDKYSWAVPDLQAIKVISFFSPLIEIGAGAGYWAKLLSDNGVKIRAFDRKISKNCWSHVQKGGPEKLLDDDKDSNLFLCYPDEATSMGVECIEKFTGEYILHIGELISTPGTGSLSEPQKPWGRTSSSDMQIELMFNFHCVLSLELQGYPHAKDHLTVWKRTEFVPGKEDYEQEEEEEEGAEAEESYGWAAIPASERMPTTMAAPKYEFLLR